MFKRKLTRGQRILWRITKPLLVLWLFLEFFRSLIPFIYSKLPTGFREFMFDGFIEYWNNYIREPLNEWLDYIPTWNAEATTTFIAFWGITFFVLARGTRKKNQVQRERPSRISTPKTCQSCHGTGRTSCFTCGGTGHGSGGATFCQSCRGRSSTSCRTCGGSGKART